MNEIFKAIQEHSKTADSSRFSELAGHWEIIKGIAGPKEHGQTHVYHLAAIMCRDGDSGRRLLGEEKWNEFYNLAMEAATKLEQLTTKSPVGAKIWQAFATSPFLPDVVEPRDFFSAIHDDQPVF